MTDDTTPIWPKPPYKGLSFYGPKDVALFAGRDPDAIKCADILAMPDTRTLFLHGATGCGKSSFLRAALLPRMTREWHGFTFLDEERDRLSGDDAKVLFIRCSRAPLKRLGEVIYDMVGNGYTIVTPVGEKHLDTSKVLQGAKSLRKFRNLIGNDASKAVRALVELSRLTTSTLILILDQAEEVGTLNKWDEENPDLRNFFEFVTKFDQLEIDLKLLITLRTEYFGDYFDLIGNSRKNFLDEIGADDGKGIFRDIVQYKLPVLKQKDIERAIKRPTLKEDVGAYGIPYKEYGFDYEPGLVEQIAIDCEETERRGGRQGGVLPVMQAVCYGLYMSTKPSRDDKIWTITEDDYTAVGGAEGCVDRYIAYAIKRRCEIESLSDTDTEAEVERWRRILFAFAEAAPGGGVTTKYIYKNDLVTLALEKGVLLDIELILEHLARDQTRIIQLVDQPGQAEAEGDEQYCLGHDAIGLSLTRWKLEDENRKFLRDELERQAKKRKTNQNLFYFSAIIAIIIPSILVYDRIFPDLSVKIHEIHTSEPNAELRFPTKGASRAILVGEPFGEHELQIDDEIIVGTISGLSVGRNKFQLNLEGHIFTAPKSVPIRIIYYPGWQVRQFPNRGLNSISPIIELDGPRIRLRDTRNGLVVKDFRQVEGSTLQEAKISPSRDFLVAGGNDGSLTVWSLRTQELLRRVSGHDAEITGLVFSPDGSILYSASADKTVKQWMLPKLEPGGTVLSRGAAILGLAISPDGQMVVSASADGTITVSNLASKLQEPQHIGSHMGKVLTIAFSPNGKLLLSTGDDKILKIWETGTWTLKKEIKDYDIRDAAFSPDGKWIFSATSYEVVPENRTGS